MEQVLQAIILGIVQGATEFLPISSSGHLVLVPWLLGWDSPTLAFDVALHLGTLAAVLLYFRRDWTRLLIAFLAGLRFRQFTGYPERIVAWLVIIGTLPAVLVGYLTKDAVERLTDKPQVVAALLLVTSVILITPSYTRGQRRLVEMGVSDALAIGFAQAFAILPGISRSGGTIAMGLFRGLAPAEAARFSFLLAIPAIIGAGLVEVPALLSGDVNGMGSLAVVAGVLAAAISGFFSIHGLLKLLSTRTLKPFALYCFIMGLLSLAVAIAP